MNIAIVGSRYYNNYNQFASKIDNILNKYYRKSITIISGGCRETDKLAERYAKERNINMSHIIIAFVSNSSRGTLNTINIARNQDKECIIIHI